MKKFDLEKALAGEPVVTRDGRPVTQLHLFNDVHKLSCLYGVVGGYVVNWVPNGDHLKEYKSDYDLFMAEKPKVKREGWVLFRPPNMVITNRIYLSETSAELQASLSDGDLIVARIEWEEEE